MRKRFVFIFLFAVFIIVGCTKKGGNDVVSKFKKKVADMEKYKITGLLTISNNDDTYNYDVEVSYKEKDNYRVTLINKSNSHEQIILKSNDEVYVMT